MKSYSDSAYPKNLEALSAKRSFLTPIPLEIQAQETEIESLFRSLVKDSYFSQDQIDIARRHEIMGWIFIVMLGLFSVLAFYVLYLKTSGD